MIAVMIISIHPRWIDKIASREKKIEVRKSRPQLKTPFKSLIYETQGATETPWADEDGHLIFKGKGQVVGEFICDEIREIKPDFEYYSYGYNIDDDMLAETCLTQEDLKAYGKGKTLYGWHISDLKIYDKPKPLFNFQTPKAKCEHISIYGLCLADSTNPPCEEIICNAHRLTRPPQSWQYIEVPDNER